MRRLLASVLALAFVIPCTAAPPLSVDVFVSSPSIRPKPEPYTLKFTSKNGNDAHGRSSVGVGIGLKEGKPFEMLFWSSGGAVAGSIAGPLGAGVGAVAGALIGLLYSIFIVPHNGPELGK